MITNAPKFVPTLPTRLVPASPDAGTASGYGTRFQPGELVEAEAEMGQSAGRSR